MGLPHDNVWELDAADVTEMLRLLCLELGGLHSIQPLVNCRGVFCKQSRPELPPDGGTMQLLLPIGLPSSASSFGPSMPGGRNWTMQTNKRMSITGKLSPVSLCQTLAALQPENCIIVDESLTSGGSYWEQSKVGHQTVMQSRKPLTPKGTTPTNELYPAER